MRSPHSPPDRCQPGTCTDDLHDSREIVGEHAECHLARDLRQRFHQEVRRAHPHLERAEGMLNRAGDAWPEDPDRPRRAERIRSGNRCVVAPFAIPETWTNARVEFPGSPYVPHEPNQRSERMERGECRREAEIPCTPCYIGVAYMKEAAN